MIRSKDSHPPCPLCQCNRAQKVRYCFPQKNSGFISLAFDVPKVFCVVRCSECGLSYLSPRMPKGEMEKVYSSADYFHDGSRVGYTDYDRQEVSLRRTFKQFLNSLRRMGLTGGRLADIGCGSGYLLDEAMPYFWLRMGTDMSQDVAKWASSICDGVVWGGPQTLAATGHLFDLVTAVSVLEHIYEPVAFLRDCAKLLDVGGYVVLVVPDFSSPWRLMMGRYWPSFKLPEHIAFYEKMTLSVLASKADMELAKTFSYGHAFPLGLILSKLGFSFSSKWHEREPCIFLPKVMMAGIFRKKSLDV